MGSDGKRERQPEAKVKSNLLTTSHDSEPVRMYVEDLAAIENLTEDTLLSELKGRMELGYFQTFVGDVLLILNPNEMEDLYTDTVSEKLGCRLVIFDTTLVFFLSITLNIIVSLVRTILLTSSQWRIVLIRMLFTTKHRSISCCLVKVAQVKLQPSDTWWII